MERSGWQNHAEPKPAPGHVDELGLEMTGIYDDLCLSNFLGAKLSWVLACFPWPVDAWEVCLSDQLVSTAATAVTAVTARLSKALRPRHHEVCPSAHRSCSSKWPGTGSKSQSFQRALPGIVTRVSWPVPGLRSANFDKKSESKANRKNKVASLEHFTNILLRNSPKFHQWCTMFTCFIVIPQLQALHQPVALIPSYITVFQFSPGQVVTVASHLISSSHHLITGLWESERWWWSSTRTCQNASVEPQKWSLEVGKTWKNCRLIKKHWSFWGKTLSFSSVHVDVSENEGDPCQLQLTWEQWWVALSSINFWGTAAGTLFSDPLLSLLRLGIAEARRWACHHHPLDTLFCNPGDGWKQKGLPSIVPSHSGPTKTVPFEFFPPASPSRSFMIFIGSLPQSALLQPMSRNCSKRLCFASSVKRQLMPCSAQLFFPDIWTSTCGLSWQLVAAGRTFLISITHTCKMFRKQSVLRPALWCFHFTGFKPFKTSNCKGMEWQATCTWSSQIIQILDRIREGLEIAVPRSLHGVPSVPLKIIEWPVHHRSAEKHNPISFTKQDGIVTSGACSAGLR